MLSAKDGIAIQSSHRSVCHHISIRGRYAEVSRGHEASRRLRMGCKACESIVRYVTITCQINLMLIVHCRSAKRRQMPVEDGLGHFGIHRSCMSRQSEHAAPIVLVIKR